MALQFKQKASLREAAGAVRFKINAVGVSNLEQTLQVQAKGAAGTHQWDRADLPKIRCSLQCAELCVLLEVNQMVLGLPLRTGVCL